MSVQRAYEALKAIKFDPETVDLAVLAQLDGRKVFKLVREEISHLRRRLRDAVSPIAGPLVTTRRGSDTGCACDRLLGHRPRRREQEYGEFRLHARAGYFSRAPVALGWRRPSQTDHGPDVQPVTGCDAGRR